MSYGMHDYLAEKAMQRQYMQKCAASEGKKGDDSPEGYDPIMANMPLSEKIRSKAAQHTPGLLNAYDKSLDALSTGFSRSRAFLAAHPEILYGLGGAGIGAGIGALVSPKRRLLGSLIGMGLGGALGAGGKLAWDKWGDDIKSFIGKPLYRRYAEGGRTPVEEKRYQAYQKDVVAPAIAYAQEVAAKGGELNPTSPHTQVLEAEAAAGNIQALNAMPWSAKNAMLREAL